MLSPETVAAILYNNSIDSQLDAQKLQELFSAPCLLSVEEHLKAFNIIFEQSMLNETLPALTTTEIQLELK